MNRVRVSIVALLVALGSLVSWSASAAPPSHTGTGTTSAPDGAPVNINSADVLVIDTFSNTVVDTVAVGISPSWVVISPF